MQQIVLLLDTANASLSIVGRCQGVEGTVRGEGFGENVFFFHVSAPIEAPVHVQFVARSSFDHLSSVFPFGSFTSPSNDTDFKHSLQGSSSATPFLQKSSVCVH